MIIKPITYPIKKSGLHIIELVFILFASSFYINYEIQGRFELIAPFIALGYIGFCYVHEKEQRTLIKYLLLFLILFALLNVLLTEGSSIQKYVSNRSLKRLYAYFSQYELVFFPLFIFYRTMKYATKIQLLIIISITLVFALLLLNSALTIALLDEHVIHSMNADVLEAANVKLVGFLFVYSFTFFVLTCMMLFARSNSKMFKLVVLFLSIYCIYFLIRAQFALSIVTTFISSLYLAYTILRKKETKILFIFGAIIVFLLLPSLVQFLIDTVQPGLLQDRLVEIYNSLTGQGVDKESDLGARLELYWKCIVAFAGSPLWGNRSLGFNGHSTFLSEFAQTGLLGGTLMVLMFVYSYKFMKEALGNKSFYFKPLMFQLVLMGLTNPIHSAPSNFIMLYFLCPLAITYFIKEKTNHLSYVSK